MQTLLEGGAAVDSLNKAGSTPFFLATEGLHRTASLVGALGTFPPVVTVYTRFHYVVEKLE